MSLIAEFTIETPILRGALDAVPDMTLQTEAFYMMSEPPKSLIWSWGDEFHTFERDLDTDPTVKEYRHITDLEDRRLYRITYAAGAEDLHTYPVLAEHDAVVLHTFGSREGLEIRARFPTRNALAAYRAACRERDIPFSLQRLYHEGEIAGDGGRNDPYGLTEPQREALERAFRMGYFSIPRETTLERIADELGISGQAVSTRLRRGQQNLLRSVLDS